LDGFDIGADELDLGAGGKDAIGAHGVEVDFVDAIEGVAEEIEADGDAGDGGGVVGEGGAEGGGCAGGEDIEDAAAEGEIAGFFDGLDAAVPGGIEPGGEFAGLDGVAFAEEAHDGAEAGGNGDVLHQGLDRGDDDAGLIDGGGDDVAEGAEAFGEEIEGDVGFAGEDFEGGKAEGGDAVFGEFIGGIIGFIDVGDDQEGEAGGEVGDGAGDEMSGTASGTGADDAAARGEGAGKLDDGRVGSEELEDGGGQVDAYWNGRVRGPAAGRARGRGWVEMGEGSGGKSQGIRDRDQGSVSGVVIRDRALGKAGRSGE